MFEKILLAGGSLQDWLRLRKSGIQKKGDKYISYEHFSVREISYNDNREIIIKDEQH